MPELPEVETVRRTLAPWILGRRVVSASLLRRDVLVTPGDPQGGFSRAGRGSHPRSLSPEQASSWLLQDATIVEIARIGKQLTLVGECSDMPDSRRFLACTWA